MRHQEAGGAGRGELGGGLVQLHPGQDAHREQQSDEDQEPDQPGQHPGPGPAGRMSQFPQQVPGVPAGGLQAALLHNIREATHTTLQRFRRRDLR